MKVVTFKVEDEFLNEIDALARFEGVTRSEVIRKALELYLKLKMPEYSAPVKFKKIVLRA